MEAAPIFITVYFNNAMIPMMTLLASLAVQVRLEHLWVGPNRASIMNASLQPQPS